MRLLIIGSQGMLGGQLIKQYASAPHEAIGWDRPEIDITDQLQVDTKLHQLKPDIVINCAAYNNVDKAEGEDYLTARMINGHAVGFLASACQEIGATLMHFSTDYVFEGSSVDGYDEASLPNPVSQYGASKLLGEQELQKNTDKFFLIRTTRLFGPPADSPVAKKSFVETLLNKARAGEEIKLVNEEQSSPTYVLDLATAVKEFLDGEHAHGIYHRTNNGSCTWYDFGMKVFELAGLTPKVEAITAAEFPRPASRPKFSVLVSTKLPPMRRWDEALAEYIKTL
ncbi:MAG: dTDP-4-dehydrorhamnose reductase [Candidatus Magasanikbacteria bacterium]|nr:dTDP-4-dehydrorhamnose reductase [Candidatus Magasanikbacteria bacterium]